MADEFDPLKETVSEPIESLYATIQKPFVKHEDKDLHPSPYENVLKTDSNQPYVYREQNSQHDNYQKLNHLQNAPKLPIRSTNPFDEDVKKASVSTVVLSQSQQEKEVREPSIPVNQLNQQISAGVYNQSYEKQSIPTIYYQDEGYNDEMFYKKRGFSTTIGRFLQRIPILRLFYQTPQQKTPEDYETEYQEEYVEQEEEEEVVAESEEAPQLVDANQSSRELTTDELALDERYSNKLRTQIIGLQAKDQTQPIGVCIHPESYTLYVCDVGRSIVEIFDMYGKLLHCIDDQAVRKFQPTAIAVGYDGTIIIASHFQHRLHMYSPVESQERSNQNACLANDYQYKQYKLGSPGHDIHQFHYPAGIAIDYTDGYLYVCDRGNFRIQVMRPEGICERIIDLFLADEEQSQVAPIQIAHQKNPERIVCLIDECDALCFIPSNADGSTIVEPFYVVDSDGLGLKGASGLAIDSEDRIFIADTGHHRIVICAPDGSYLTHFGEGGSKAGELQRPCGLAITNDGTLVVADSGNKRLQLFGSIREQVTDDKNTATDKSDVTNINLIDTE